MIYLAWSIKQKTYCAAEYFFSRKKHPLLSFCDMATIQIIMLLLSAGVLK